MIQDGSSFSNLGEISTLWVQLEKLWNSKFWTPVHCNNLIAIRISNDLIERSISRSTVIWYSQLTDQINLGSFKMRWFLGKENISNYASQNYIIMHNRNIWPKWLHIKNHQQYFNDCFHLFRCKNVFDYMIETLVSVH